MTLGNPLGHLEWLSSSLVPTLSLRVKLIFSPFLCGYLSEAALSSYIHCELLSHLFIFYPGFGSDSGNPHLPHNHEYNQVVYSGTHDNDTVKSSSPCVCLSSKMIIFIGGIVRVGPVPGAFENLVIVLENKDMKTVKELPLVNLLETSFEEISSKALLGNT